MEDICSPFYSLLKNSEMLHCKEEKYFAVRLIRTLLGSIFAWISGSKVCCLDHKTKLPAGRAAKIQRAPTAKCQRPNATLVLNFTFPTLEPDSTHRPWRLEPNEETATSHEPSTFAGREHHSQCDSPPLSQEMALYLEQDLCD